MNNDRYIRLLLFSLLLTAALAHCLPTAAQRQVAPCSGWLATVDTSTGQIVLRWRPSDDSLAVGYHICSGDTCRAYAVTNGRFDTSYVCSDHSPLSRHVYRIHVFDADGNVSVLTPPFGNIVLHAEIPPCATAVSASWTPYSGMPAGIGHYALYARFEPLLDEFEPLFTTDSAGPLAFSFELPEAATHVYLRVLAWNSDSSLVSCSNTVAMQRHTADTASSFGIDTAVADSLIPRVRLSLHTDTAFAEGRYTLWRSVNGGEWTSVANLHGHPTSFTDNDFRPRSDTLLCYRLSVVDGCGSNPKYSKPCCVAVPTPPEPAFSSPNVLLAGDADNGMFKPCVAGLAGDYYELSVYDRLGRLVFHSTSPDEGWTPLPSTPQGCYAYILRARFNDDEIRSFAGTLTVVK